ncbi:MAG: efflux RND transporter periplasmic adaptor subunit [Comamonadaceae bacterium]|nr:MAG: efflux RND transporter periplasmic adaptor subunit [Comamonadaceae bacterium]
MKATKPQVTLAAMALCILAGATGLLASGSLRAADEKKPEPKPALTVATAVPQRVNLPVALSANGNITAWQEASVGAEGVALRLTEVRVNVGDQVRKGQVLATFAPDTLRAEAAQARASLAEAEASAADAAGNAERARSLQATGALSASQINQYFTAEKTAKARVEAARALFQAQTVRLNQTQVLAPDSGIISARTATVGAVVGNGTELFRLIRQGRLEWRAEVTSSELGRLTTGTTAVVTAASGARLAGRVRTVGPTVDAQTRSALVYVDLTPLPGPFSGSARAGMFARGEFDLGATPALTVPQPAVIVRDGFSYVLRVGPDNRVAQVKVQTGRLAGDRIEITGGLPADARVVASGAGFLNDGDLVRIVEAPAATVSKPNQAPAQTASAPVATK